MDFVAENVYLQIFFFFFWSLFSMADFMVDFYMKPYNRMGPYIVGMLAGYFLYHTDCKLRINKVAALVCISL